MTRSLTASLADLERTDPAVAKAAATYERDTAALLKRLRAQPLTTAQWDRVRLIAIGCASADRARGVPWCCTCPWCAAARREVAARAAGRQGT